MRTRERTGQGGWVGGQVCVEDEEGRRGGGGGAGGV